MSHPLLYYYKKKLYEGDILAHQDFFKKEKRSFLFDSDERVEYQLLRASWFSSLGDFEKSYKVLNAIDERNLYAEELDTVNVRRAFALTQMGAMKEAELVLGNPDVNKSQNPSVWLAYSYIYENYADIDKAVEFANKAKDYAVTCKKIPDWQIGQVYNNYARVLLIKGDGDQAYRYLGLAFQKVEHYDDFRVYSRVASNYIIRSAIMGEPRERCEELLEHYKKRAKANSIDNLVALNNCQFAVYRQFGDENRVLDLLQNGYWEIKEKASGTQAEVLKASTFEILINGSYVHDWFDAEISDKWSTFKRLESIDRLKLFRTYSLILSHKENRHLLRCEPYRKLYKLILDYYHKAAIKEVDTMLHKVESYNLYKYQSLMDIKLDILKLVERGNHIANSGELYKQLSEQLYASHLRVDGTIALMHLIKECESPRNMLVSIPPYPHQLLIDFIERTIPLPPVPEVLSDKIHTAPLMFTMPREAAIAPLQLETIEENIEIVSMEIDKWQNHPAKVEISLEIAHTYMALEKPEKAKKYYDYYLSTRIAPTVLPIWFRETIADLQKNFGY